MEYSAIYKNKLTRKLFFNFPTAAEKNCREEAGFSLVEVIIALLILLIVLLGVFATFVYAINYNSGNNARAQGLTVLQQQVEKIRSEKFTPQPLASNSILKSTGGEKTLPSESRNGNIFKVKVTVDDDPFTDGIQINNATTMKEIKVTVTLESPTPGWQTAIPTSVVLRRVRAN